MPSNDSRSKFYWSAADGAQLEIVAGTAQIAVSAGVSIQVGPGVEGEGRPAVDLDLVTRVREGGDAGELGKRFVVIPLDESSLLVAVAEPSEEPANLCPVVSTPVWVAPGGGSMPTADGSLTMRGVSGAQIGIALVPGPAGHRNICVLRISGTAHIADGSGSPKPRALLLRDVSPRKIRVETVPSVAI